jgi:hypothetical protein
VTCGRDLQFTGQNLLRESPMRQVPLIALLSLTVLAGCRNATEPLGDSNAAPIDILSPLTLTTSVSSATLAPGGTVTVTVKLTNVSSAPVNVNANDCPRRFVVDTRDGHSALSNSEICSLALMLRTMAPGESISFTESWDGMTLVGDDALGRVPPGRYVVRGSSSNGAVRMNAGAELTILP